MRTLSATGNVRTAVIHGGFERWKQDVLIAAVMTYSNGMTVTSAVIVAANLKAAKTINLREVHHRTDRRFFCKRWISRLIFAVRFFHKMMTADFECAEREFLTDGNGLCQLMG